MKDLEIDIQNDIVIVKVSPNLTQYDYMEMRGYFTSNYFAKQKVKIIIDCEKVLDLPSIAFGVFSTLARDARRIGGDTKLVHVAVQLKKIMSRTHIDKQINILNTIAEAIQSF
ncbi:MAG: STAS domain-containing protein [Desulfobacterales bacterium]|nr:STAS domain-containing protein [Desulfobacterales bacterium]MBF0397435.1 STAS domain-containing protein [Desulfobacterales bacterium]